MKELPEQAAQCNKNSINKTFWSGEHQLNQRETLQLTLSDYQGKPILDLRRWLDPGGGEPRRPTKKGVGCALKNLPALVTLFESALRHARAVGLLPDEVRMSDTITASDALSAIRSREKQLAFAQERIAQPVLPGRLICMSSNEPAPPPPPPTPEQVADDLICQLELASSEAPVEISADDLQAAFNRRLATIEPECTEIVDAECFAAWLVRKNSDGAHFLRKLCLDDEWRKLRALGHALDYALGEGGYA